MNQWPELSLTDYERRFVRYYETTQKDEKGRTRNFPGVLRRIYPLLLSNLAYPAVGILNPILNAQLQITRRSRVFAFSFAGDLDSWFLNIRTASGESFTPGSPGTPDGGIVSSLVAGTPYHWQSQIARDTPSNVNQGTTGSLLEFEPNIQLASNTTLVFEGQANPPEASPGVLRRIVLHITCHVWEFPGMTLSEDEARQEAKEAQKPASAPKRLTMARRDKRGNA